MLYIFAVRATDPTVMKRAVDSVGPENREWFDRVLLGSPDGPVVCAWGVHGEYRGQGLTVLGWLAQ